MKNIIFTLVFCLPFFLKGQCPTGPQSNEFKSQQEIDDFIINFPNCTEFPNAIVIDEASQGDIQNLNGFANITSLGGLYVQNNSSLTNLNGLSGLTSLSSAGGIVIDGNDALLNLNGLDNLTQIDVLWIRNNSALLSLNGLEGLNSISTDLIIENNASLPNLSGLNSLSSVGGLFYVLTNNSLTSLSGAENLETIGSVFQLNSNSNLADVNTFPLLNLTFILSIQNNPLLSICNATYICNHLGNFTSFQNNATGCNSVQEVETSCVPIANCCSTTLASLPGSDCCYYIEVSINPSVPCAINQVTVSIDNMATTIISEAIPNLSIGSFTSGVQNNQTVVFGTPSIFNPPTGQSSMIIGEICFENDIPESSLINIDVQELSGGGCSSQAIIDILPACSPSPQPEDFRKYYGNSLGNKPNVIKAFGDGVYVVGVESYPEGTISTFSKFDITNGNLVWDINIPALTYMTDFEYVPEEDAFLLVGRTIANNLPGPQNNQSELVKIDDNGNMVFNKLHNQEGREGFSRILRHPNPINLQFPYYILGTNNPIGNSSPPTAFDLTTLFNIDKDGNVNWIKEYEYENGNEEAELLRGLVPKPNGNVVLLGNDIPDNSGLIVEVNGFTGDVFNPKRINPSGHDLYDGVVLPNGTTVIAGHDFVENEAFISLWDNNLNPISALDFKQLGAIRDIGLDELGNIYFTAPSKISSFPYEIVVKMQVSSTGTLTVVWSKYLVDEELSSQNGTLTVTPNHNKIFYADEREHPTLGFGDNDIFLGAFDLDLMAICGQDFQVSIQPLDITAPLVGITAIDTNEPNFGSFNDVMDLLGYQCESVCGVPDSCDAAFEWENLTNECYCISFKDLSTSSTDIVTWEWDLGTGTINQQNPTACFPSAGTYEVCLTITTTSGCTDTQCESVTTFDQVIPTIFCPQNITITNTDQGVCCATFDPMLAAFDNCQVTIFSELSGATTGDNPNTCYNVGITTVTSVAVDDSGNTSPPCIFTVTVEDNEAPIIDCPNNINVMVDAGCTEGRTVQFNMPTATDNCELESITCDYNSGDFFPCGITTVTCTAIDIYGNQSTCTFQINVTGCNQCANIISAQASCTDNTNMFDFVIEAENLTTLDWSLATVSVSGVGFSDVIFNAGTITGTITVDLPASEELEVQVTFDFACPLGPISCNLPVTLTTPCCEEVTIEDQAFCSVDDIANIMLEGCDDLFNVQQVNWYYGIAEQNGSCSNFPLNQVSFTCEPLQIPPSSFSPDDKICVYADVLFSSGPCQKITSNTAQITFCQPVGCSISGSEDYCYDGTPVIPNALSVSPNNTDWEATYQWFENGELIDGAIFTNYQPNPLSHISGNNGDCFTSYTYSVEITSLCGTQICSTVINVFNNEATNGLLTLYYPDESLMPFCPGQDATLYYDKSCLGPAPTYSDEWTWFKSSSSSTGPWETLNATGGTINQYLNTNRLHSDTWFKVERINGACGVGEITYFLDFVNPTELISFNAEYGNDFCNPTGVEMNLNLFTESPSGVTIDWYKDGEIVETIVTTTFPQSFLYDSEELGGNYYAIITDNYCGTIFKTEVIVIEKLCAMFISGPCFVCNGMDVTLNGVIANLPSGVTCTYQWYKGIGENKVPFAGAETETLITNEYGDYTFIANCGDCEKVATFNLLGCGDLIDAVEVIEKEIGIKVIPNPFNNQFVIEFESPLTKELQLKLRDVQGRILQQQFISIGLAQVQITTNELSSGIYFLELSNENGLIGVSKLVKQK